MRHWPVTISYFDKSGGGRGDAVLRHVLRRLRKRHRPDACGSTTAIPWSQAHRPRDAAARRAAAGRPAARPRRPPRRRPSKTRPSSTASVPNLSADRIDRRLRRRPLARRRDRRGRRVGEAGIGEVRRCRCRSGGTACRRLPGEQVGAGREDAVGELGRVGELAAAGAEAEVGGLQLQRHRPPGEPGLLQPPRDLLRQRAENRPRARAGRRCRSSKVVSALTLLASPSGSTVRSSSAARQPRRGGAPIEP